MQDAIIKIVRTNGIRYYRLEGKTYFQPEALFHLQRAGFSPGDARQYLNVLPVEWVEYLGGPPVNPFQGSTN